MKRFLLIACFLAALTIISCGCSLMEEVSQNASSAEASPAGTSSSAQSPDSTIDSESHSHWLTPSSSTQNEDSLTSEASSQGCSPSDGTYSYNSIPGVYLPEDFPQKIIISDNAMGQIYEIIHEETIGTVLEALSALKVHNQTDENYQDSSTSLFFIDCYKLVDDDTPMYTIFFNPFEIRIQKSTYGPFLTDNSSEIIIEVLKPTLPQYPPTPLFK